ncbi:hypothetical protein [Actinoplanes sp. NPDC026670]|uniref:hypothetical protein n=1 Tax=Actinoplanes sp. NPDC026670 TaxID=3154700 RepID=UPI0034115689
MATVTCSFARVGFVSIQIAGVGVGGAMATFPFSILVSSARTPGVSQVHKVAGGGMAVYRRSTRSRGNGWSLDDGVLEVDKIARKWVGWAMAVVFDVRTKRGKAGR